MRHRLLYAISITMILLAGVAPADDGSMADHQTEILTNALDLSLEQQDRVKTVFVEAYRLREEDERAYAGELLVLQEAASEREAAIDAQLEDILTGDQMLKYREMQSDEDQISKVTVERTGQVQELVDRLSLSESQASVLDEIFAENGPRLDELKRTMSQHSGDRRSMMQTGKALRSVMQEIDSRIEEVLTQDQIEEYRRYKDERREEMRQQMGKGGGRRRG